MVSNLSSLILAQTAGAATPFLDGTYQSIPIRYRNLPIHTVTIDYALNANTLLITTSKNSMFAAIDALR
jgi:hypothetical protein